MNESRIKENIVLVLLLIAFGFGMIASFFSWFPTYSTETTQYYVGMPFDIVIPNVFGFLSSSPRFGIGFFGVIVPVILAMGYMFQNKKELDDSWRGISLATMISFIGHVFTSDVGVFGTYNSTLSFLIIISAQTIPVMTLYEMKGVKTAAVLIVSFLFLSIPFAELLALLLRQMPYTSFGYDFVWGGRGLVSPVYSLSIAIIPLLAIAKYGAIPSIDDNLISFWKLRVACRRLETWFHRKSIIFKAIAIVIVFLIFSLYAIGFSVSPLRSFGQENGSWGFAEVEDIESYGISTLVRTETAIHTTGPQGSQKILEIDYVKDMEIAAGRYPGMYTPSSNESILYLATSEDQASLKRIIVLGQTQPETLDVPDIALNRTFSEIEISDDGKLLFALDYSTGLWEYNTQNHSMTLLSKMSDFQRNEQSDTIYFFDVQNQYIFLGTRRSGFYVYDILNEEWLEPSNVKGQRAIVYTMAYSAQLQKLFVGTFSGIIEYSFVNSSLEYSRIITSADGLPSSAVVSLRYDSSTGGLIVATSSRICIFYPETGKIEHIEESEIDYLTDVYAEIVSLWYMGVYHIYFRSEYGRLFHYYVDYETLNRGIWQIVYSLQQNIVTIFVSVGSSVAILWSKLAIGEDETRQKRKRSLMRRIKRS